jgi:membrane protein implicated in regulation of membrane protease activity/membrane protease YdiL (CAAX protease family)
MHHLILLFPLVALVLFLFFPWPAALPLYVLILVGSLIAYWKALQAQLQPPIMGKRVMVGDEAIVVSTTWEKVEVEYQGEIWNAVSSQPLEPGQRVIINQVEGLTLRVVPIPPTPGKSGQPPGPGDRKRPGGKLMEILQAAFPGDVHEPADYPLTGGKYWAGLFIIFACAYSQYLIERLGPFAALLIVYGIPIWVVSHICGYAIIRKSFRHTYAALKFGVGLFGIFSLLGVIAAYIIFSLTMMVDPRAANLLYKPNPVLHVPPELAWIMIWLSLIVVAPAEEFIFRGFVYGGMLVLFKNRHWLSLAFLSSGLFAMAHLYYALVYGVVSLAIFAELLFVGIAFATTYYLSGGNLLIPVLLHGLYDASGFMTVAMSPEVGMMVRWSMVAAGILVGLGFLGRRAFSLSRLRRR